MKNLSFITVCTLIVASCNAAESSAVTLANREEFAMIMQLRHKAVAVARGVEGIVVPQDLSKVPFPDASIRQTESGIMIFARCGVPVSLGTVFGAVSIYDWIDHRGYIPGHLLLMDKLLASGVEVRECGHYLAPEWRKSLAWVADSHNKIYDVKRVSGEACREVRRIDRDNFKHQGVIDRQWADAAAHNGYQVVQYRTIPEESTN